MSLFPKADLFWKLLEIARSLRKWQVDPATRWSKLALYRIGYKDGYKQHKKEAES